MYFWISGREILKDEGYEQEIFEGEPMNIPKGEDNRAYIESCISKILACIEGSESSYDFFLFVYDKECGTVIERWVLTINTNYDVWRRAIPTMKDLMGEMTILFFLLPTLDVPCDFRAYILK
ncbi:uncharacterized protein LOC125763250 isoform X2 [Anopheles funestus]|nr:uncharacterized protein LOC125763250 isoform X2 [Anopheles funestus]